MTIHPEFIALHTRCLSPVNRIGALACSRIDFPWPIWSDAFVTLSCFLRQTGETAHGLCHPLAAADAGDYHVDHGEGRVEVAASPKLFDLHTGGGQRGGVSDALVAQRIEFTGHDIGRRQVRALTASRPA